MTSASTAALPTVISCGEPAGVGPEIAAKAWAALKNDGPLLWIGDPTHLPGDTPWQLASGPEDAAAITPHALPVLRRDFGAPVVHGTPDPTHAPHIIAAIAEAVDLVQTGRAAALCTAPISKAALIEGADFAYPGHTEFLAALAGDVPVAMMLACDALRVVPATIHIPISAVPAALTPELLGQTVRITARALTRDFGIATPRIAVAGLNPHAGEDGKIGREEVDWMIDCLAALRDEGLDVHGPASADTMFHEAARARYDAAVCMYHDQALIPIKTLDFSSGVNVTLGLPFVRTSPDHGTAYDIAGTGTADPTSMIAALRMARQMSVARTA